MYGKLSGNSIMPAPYYLVRNGVNIFGYNLEGNSEMLLQDGYKPVVDSDTPPESFINPRKVWTETENSIVASWVDDYVEPTVEEQNEAIRQTRESLYFQTSDRIKADYDEAVARGSENAEELKKAWLASKDKIRAENPYIDNKEKKGDNELLKI